MKERLQSFSDGERMNGILFKKRGEEMYSESLGRDNFFMKHKSQTIIGQKWDWKRSRV